MTTEPERVDDEWWTFDRPMLVHMSRQLLDCDRDFASVSAAGEALGLDRRKTIEVSERLDDAGYIELTDGMNAAVRRIRERGLREVGTWPDEAAVLERLLVAVEKALAAATPDQRTW